MLRMLIVEDERLEREGLLEFLDWSSFGIEVVETACDGIEGIELARKMRPDLIITDIKMSGMAGLEMSKKIKEFLPEVKIIILSGYNDFKFAKEAIRFQAYAYLLKPVEEKEMIEVIKGATNECIKAYEMALEESKNKLQIEESYSVARTQFIADLFEGRVKKDELYEYLKYFHINLIKEDNILVMIIRQSKLNDSVIIYEQDLFNIINNNIDEFKNKSYFNVEKSFLYKDSIRNQLVACISLNSEEDFDTLLHYISNKYLARIKRENNVELQIGIGKKVETIDDIHLSYNSALEAIEFGEFWLIQGLTYYEGVEANSKKFEDRLCEFVVKGNYFSKNLVSALSSSEEDKVYQLITDMFDYINNTKCTDRDILNNYLYNIINEVSLFVYNINKRTEEFMQDYNDSIKAFMTLSNINAIKEYFYTFFGSVLAFLNEKRGSKDESIVKKVIKLIDKKYMECISLKTIASEVYLSPNYLGNIFKKVTGKTFNVYLCEYRMGKAKELLSKANKKVSIVAQEVGIPNTSYFCMVFKNTFGIAPGEFHEMVIRG
ncbi:hypothetical protein CSC2_42990 [Clostridium zeae]|uniref:Stage 0 sporulation protein A homolog n=1 Tax=Clostridium zeae TaxID=2759022 RepID=A0ABQ1EG10_9CLOT|nr:response regulator [Clostridium zeae]GFZ33773.1 hypothetical protein CSC2_42990 [Clostridium zeae]